MAATWFWWAMVILLVGMLLMTVLCVLQRDIPIAVVTSTAFCTVLYMAMATVVVGMVYYADVSPAAPFSDAFRQVGYNWAAYIVSIGAIAGTFNSALVDLYSLGRLIVVLGRAGLMPHALVSGNKVGLQLGCMLQQQCRGW